MKRSLIALAVVAGLVLFLSLWGPAACNKIRSLTAQSKLDTAQGDAFQNSAGDAIETQGAANKRERESDDLTRTNEKEIRDAKGASDPVDAGVRDAGLLALCRRATYRDSERCRLLRAPAR